MNENIGDKAKGLGMVSVFVAGSFLGYGMLLSGLLAFGWSLEPKLPDIPPPAQADMPPTGKADMPEMPPSVPTSAVGAEPASGPVKAEVPPAKPEPNLGEKRSPEPKPGSGAEPPIPPSPESKAPAEPAVKQEGEPSAKPKTQTPAPPPTQPAESPKTQLPAKTKGEPTAKQQAPEPILEWPVDDAQRKNRADVATLIRAKTLSPEQLKQVEAYYTQYGLARWTQLANRAEVRKYREELLRELAQTEGQTREQLLQMVMNLLIKMAEGNHHPVARVNAVLALGELNRVESQGTQPPEPLSAVQPFLFRTLENPQMPQALRVAALLGLRRHADLGAVSDQTKSQWIGALISIIQEPSPSGRSAAGYYWLRQLAIEVLESLKPPTANTQVVPTLVNVLNDTNNPMNIRVAAARTLGKLDYAQGFPGDLNKLLREMGQLALDALNPELERYEKEKKLLARQLQTYLIGVYNGLIGLQKVASQPKETADLYQKILDAVRSCAVLFENPKLRDEDGKLLEDKMAKQLALQKKTLAEAITAPVAPASSPTEKPKPTSGG